MTDIINDPFFEVTPESPATEENVAIAGRELGNSLRERVEHNKKLQEAIEKLAHNPDIDKEFLKEANKTISHYDNHIIKTVYITALSTYLENPLNFGLKAESGSGKTYSANETLKFFPPEDVVLIGSQSPKVISHENGIQKTFDGQLFDEIKKPERPLRRDYPDKMMYDNAILQYENDLVKYNEASKSCYWEVDLRHKTIAFFESIDLDTFKMFKTTMSHDNPYIDHKWVDDKGKVHVTRLIGAPAIIFCSLDNVYFEEWATRNLSASPVTDQNKYQSAMGISCQKSNYPWEFENRFEKEVIQEYLRKISGLAIRGKLKGLNPFKDIHRIFSDIHTRDMRDFNKFLEMLPSFALFKLFQRPIIEINKCRYLVPTIQDAIEAKELFESLKDTTVTNTEKRVVQFYQTYIQNYPNGKTIKILTNEYNKDHPKNKRSSGSIREWITRLELINWVDVREGEQETSKGYIDHKTLTIYPLIIKNNEYSSFSENKTNYSLDFQKAFENWLKDVSEKNQLRYKIYLLNTDGSAKIISKEDFIKIISNTPIINTETSLEDNLTIESENILSDITVSENKLNSGNKKILIIDPCLDGTRCQGTADDGDQCRYAAEEILYQDDSKPGIFCKTHMDKVLNYYNPQDYEIRRGKNQYEELDR